MKHLVVGQGKLGRTILNSLERIKYRVCHTVESADIVWITVPDSAIRSMVKQLEKDLKPDTVLVHCSGFFPASILKNQKTDKLVSLHPAYSFSRSLMFFPHGIFWTFQGRESLFDYFKILVEKWKGKIAKIEENQKPLYHSACVFASNFPVISLIIAKKLFEQCGIDYEHIFKGLVSPLCEKVSKNSVPEQLLTGPAVRRDLDTILKEIEVLKEKDENISEIYRLLSEFVLQNM